MKTGNTSGYFWAEDPFPSLNELVVTNPDIFVSRTVAITSFDSGPLTPNEDETQRGWFEKGGVFYAPNVSDPSELPRDCYDEWYVFDDLKEFSVEDRFVNYGDFFLRDPNYQLEEADPTWDKVAIRSQIEYQKERQNQFWDYVVAIQPRCFVMEGSILIYGTRDKDEFESLLEKSKKRQWI